jgi:hypothetical protein
MSKSSKSALAVSASVCAIVVAFSLSAAMAADLTVTNAKIQAGKLFITGKTLTAGTKVRLDGQAGEAFNVVSSATKTFVFSVVYHPDDCIVTLQKFTPPATLGVPTNAIVADCGPKGVIPRGAWVPNAPNGSYLANDLVTFQGSRWRAKRASIGKSPATHPADWEKFAARGATGPAGPSGATAPRCNRATGSRSKGPTGATRAAGPRGDWPDRSCWTQRCNGSARTRRRRAAAGTLALHLRSRRAALRERLDQLRPSTHSHRCSLPTRRL